MAKRKAVVEANCPIARSVEVVGDRWTLLIVRDALRRTRRFSDFQKSLGISKSMLAERLQTMVENGLLELRPDPEGSAYPRYHLTGKGRRLHTVLERLLEEISFTATDKAGDTITVDAAYVNERVAPLAQNGDGLRANQAGTADDDDLHSLSSVVDDWRPPNGFEGASSDIAEQWETGE